MVCASTGARSAFGADGPGVDLPSRGPEADAVPISRPTSDSPAEPPCTDLGVGPVAALGGAPVHDHLCAFYRGRAERDRLVLDYLQEGLRAGNTCL
jgi:hypothetical protein